MFLCDNRLSNSSLRKSPPVPVRVCSRSPVKIWTKAREECSKNGKSGLSALLGLIIDSEKAEDKKRGKERMSGRGVTKNRPLGNQEAAEKGIGLEERGAVDRENINIGSFGYALCQASCVLRANVLMCITE